MAKMVKATADNLKDIPADARVKLKPAFSSGTKYFICYLSEGYCLIADCKKDLRESKGYIHSIYSIDSFEALE